MFLYNSMALFVAFLWGCSAVVDKYLLKRYTNNSLMIFNSTIYLVILYIFIFPSNYKTIINDFKNLNIYDISLVLFSTLVLSYVSKILYAHSLQNHNTSYTVTALTSTYPLFTLLLVYMIFEQKVTPLGITGTILIILGIIALSWDK